MSIASVLSWRVGLSLSNDICMKRTLFSIGLLTSFQKTALMFFCPVQGTMNVGFNDCPACQQGEAEYHTASESSV